MNTNQFDDVGRFHARFGLPHSGDGAGPPAPLDPDVQRFRIKFMLEELAEYCESQGARRTAAALMSTQFVVEHEELAWTPQTLATHPPAAEARLGALDGGADALADLVYVALGTAHLHRLPFDDVWDGVQRANMAKVRAESAADPRSKRVHAFDVVKPAGWVAPDHRRAIVAAGARFRGELPRIDVTTRTRY